MRGVPIDATGKRYGHLTAISIVTDPAIKNQGNFWLCKCDCGNTTQVRMKDLSSGNTGSCGCQKQAKGQSCKAPRIAMSRPWRKDAA